MLEKLSILMLLNKMVVIHVAFKHKQMNDYYLIFFYRPLSPLMLEESTLKKPWTGYCI